MQLSISDQVLLQRLDDEIVLLNMENDRYFGLQNVSARAWELITETGNTEAVFATLLGEYPVDETTLRQDLDELVNQLIDAGLVTVLREDKGSSKATSAT